jgi:putative N-acetylmannosamine-6-phosphate epimerase
MTAERRKETQTRMTDINTFEEGGMLKAAAMDVVDEEKT